VKYWYLSGTLHGVTSQKAVHILTIVRFTVPTAVAVVWDVITVQLEDAVASKCRYIFVKLHGVTSRKAVHIQTIVRFTIPLQWLLSGMW
jgi:hypothetical protein